MSMSASCPATRFTRVGSVSPSIYKRSTRVADWRPTVCSRMRSSGALMWRRTMEVLVRRLSTKASRAPLSTVSLLGAEMERFSSVPVNRESTADSPGKNSRHQPDTRSKAA